MASRPRTCPYCGIVHFEFMDCPEPGTPVELEPEPMHTLAPAGDNLYHLDYEDSDA